jgi:hypothetical protein
MSAEHTSLEWQVQTKEWHTASLNDGEIECRIERDDHSGRWWWEVDASPKHGGGHADSVEEAKRAVADWLGGQGSD